MKSWFLALFFALALALAGVHWIFEPLFGDLREKTYDTYQSIAPINLVIDQVAVVAIDEASLSRYGRWPWPREVLADLVDAVAASGAAATGVDLFLAEPDTAAGGMQSDSDFAAALGRSANVLAMSLDADAGPLRVEGKAGWSVVGLDPSAAAAVTGGIAPLREFARAASGLGIVRTLPDRDGVIRKVPLVWADAGDQDGARLWPAFALEILRVAQDAPSYTLRLEGLAGDAVRVGEATVPLGDDGRIRLIDTATPVPHVTANDLLTNGGANALGGRIAIIAVDAAGLDRYHITARGGHRLGADIHAILLTQMLQGLYLDEAPQGRMIERGFFLGGSVLLFLILAGFARRPFLAVAFSAPVIAAPIVAGFWTYTGLGMLLDGVQPAAGLLVMGAAGGYGLYREAERRRRVLQKQFGQFLSPEVVRHLAETDTAAALQVEDREITAMLVDVRGFTALSGALNAQQTVAVVNHFIEIANREIFERGGTVDKYMGDSVLAFWNAPLETDDHADRAIDCASAILRGVKAANPQLEARGLPAIEIVAVIETGVCSVGNMGTEERIDYTAIGPAINMTARLEGETKKRGEPIMIGPGTAAASTLALQELAVVQLRGIEEPCSVFAPL